MKEYRELIVSLIGLVVVLVGAISTIWNVVDDPAQFRAFILIGYVIFAGGIFWFAFKGTAINSTYRWISLGFLYLVTIPFFIWVGSWSSLPEETAADPCSEYGIEIIDKQYTLINGEVIIEGKITNEPPPNSLQLIGIADEKYWPHNQAFMTVTRNAWNGKSFGESNYTVAIAYTGENGRILFDYFQSTGEILGQYPGIETLPDDVVICDSAAVNIQ